MCIGDTAADVTPDFKVEITFWVCLMQRFRKQPPHHCMNLLFHQPVIYKASSSTIIVRTHIFNSCEGVLDSDIHVYTPQVSCMNTGKVFFTQLLISQNGKKKFFNRWFKVDEKAINSKKQKALKCYDLWVLQILLSDDRLRTFWWR